MTCTCMNVNNEMTNTCLDANYDVASTCNDLVYDITLACYDSSGHVTNTYSDSNSNIVNACGNLNDHVTDEFCALGCGVKDTCLASNMGDILSTCVVSNDDVADVCCALDDGVMDTCDDSSTDVKITCHVSGVVLKSCVSDSCEGVHGVKTVNCTIFESMLLYHNYVLTNKFDALFLHNGKLKCLIYLNVCTYKI